MFLPHTSARPSDIYTVRLANTETQHTLANRLRRVVTAGGAAWTLDLLEGRGFMWVFPRLLVLYSYFSSLVSCWVEYRVEQGRDKARAGQ